MTHLLNPATGKYLLNPAPEHLHDEVVQWQSDIEFYNTELIFLGKLIDKAFLRITSAPKMAELKTLEEKLKSVQQETIGELRSKFIQHEHELSTLDMDIFKMRRKRVEEAHKRHWEMLNSFVGKTRQLKNEVFGFVEKQLKLSKEVKAEYESGSIAL
ncbi:MAG: hypothetical protein NTV09_09630 [Bacteroidetes bacterium]|nr:hypothetical protein [Bacteroidota bacterium]